MGSRMRIEGVEVRLVSDDHAAVMATKDYRTGTIIEVCPIVPLSVRDTHFIKETDLGQSLFSMGKGRSFIPGGYGAIYTSFGEDNAEYEVIEDKRSLVIKARKKIPEGEFISLSGRDQRYAPRFEYNEPLPWHSGGLEVRPSKESGLGVFTTRHFERGSFVEVNHVVGLSREESYMANLTRLRDYFYTLNESDDHDPEEETSGWALGYSSFYNDSERGIGDVPNINPWCQIPSIGFRHIAAKALVDLPPGTELLFDYTDEKGRMSDTQDDEQTRVKS